MTEDRELPALYRPPRVGDAGRAAAAHDTRILPWGGVEFRSHELDPHFAVMGIVNSGKTLTIRMLMRGALMSPDGALLHRAIVFDPKRDFYPILRGMGVPKEQIHVLHPFDARSTAWDVATDIQDQASAFQLATILAPPDERSNQPFFSNAALELVAGVIDVLRTQARGLWSLNDVLELTRNKEGLIDVLGRTEDGRDLADHYLHGGRSASDVMSTLRTKLAPYKVAARLWSRAESKVSLAGWANSKVPSVLLLGTDDTNSACMAALNRAIVRRASELVTGRVDEDPQDESWFILDEFRWAGGQLDGVQELLVKGRSKGGRVVLGFQDLQGLRHVYGREQAEELVAMCGNMAVLRIDSPETRSFAARYFGKYEGYVWSYSRTHADKTSSTTDQWTLQERDAILEQEFHVVPPPMKGRGIPGAFRCPYEAWKDVVPSAFIEKHLAPKSDDLGFVPRPQSDQERLPACALLPGDHVPSGKAIGGISAGDQALPSLRVPSWLSSQDGLRVVRADGQRSDRDAAEREDDSVD